MSEMARLVMALGLVIVLQVTLFLFGVDDDWNRLVGVVGTILALTYGVVMALRLRRGERFTCDWSP